MGLDIYFYRVHKTIEEIGYFRKVNFLVAFFEEQLGKEVRNCEGIPVSKEDVEILNSYCKDILLAHTDIEAYCLKKEIPEEQRAEITDESVAATLLPTQSGFFFGDTEYDEYYFNNIKEVLNYTEELLPQFEDLEEDEYIEFYIWY